MKRFLIIFSLFPIISWGQYSRSQSDILGIPNTHIIKDLNLKTQHTFVPKRIDERFYDQRKKRSNGEITTELKRSKIYFIDHLSKKLKSSSFTINDKTTSNEYTYDSKGRLKFFKSNSDYLGKKEEYTYNANGDFYFLRTYLSNPDNPQKHSFLKTNDGYITEGITEQKFVIKDNQIIKIIKNPAIRNLTYNEKGQLISEKSRMYTTTYAYNSLGDLSMTKEVNNRSNESTTRTFVYKYDKYGNWIICLTSLEMSTASWLPSFPNPTLRQIVYSHGEITGTVNIEKAEKDLVELRKKASSRNTTSKNSAATWKKPKSGDFIFYLNGKGVYPKDFEFGAMGKDILLFHSPSKKLYALRNFTAQAVNTVLNAEKLSLDITHGYWYKKSNGAVVVFKNNGVYMEKNSLYKYAPNNIDVFYQGEGEPNKVVLKNYRNAQSYTVYPAIAFNQYNPKKTNTNVVAKRSGTCLKGDCDNGYGEFKHSNGYMSEGFFKNEGPYGPMHVSLEKKDESSIAFLKGNYKAYNGMRYRYYDNRFTEMVDFNKQMGVVNDAKEQKSYVYNFKNGKVVSKTLLKQIATDGCIAGNCYNGAGVYKYSGGSFYFGFFKNGKRHGFGKLDFKDGRSYLGEFDMDIYSGMGTYIISKYNYYMGEFKNNTFNGQGVMYYSKTNYKAGYWKGGHYQGKSTTTN